MFKSLSSAFKNKDIRTKLLYVLLLLFIYRIGSFIPIPGVNINAWKTATGYLTALSDYMKLLSGSAFSNFTIFAMGISPYITASIVIQLLCVVFDKLDNLKRNDDKKLEMITSITGIVFSAIQSLAIVISYNKTIQYTYGEAIVTGTGWAYAGKLALIALVSAAGTGFLVWFCHKLIDKGISNGVSILIFTSIVSNIAQSFVTTISGKSFGIITAVTVIVSLLMIGFTVYVDNSSRNVPTMYSRARKNGSTRSMMPMKVNANGVLPLIFTMTILQFPEIIIQFTKPGSGVANFFYRWFSSNPRIWNGLFYESTGILTLSKASHIGFQYMPFVYYLFYFVLIIAFGYFYTSITFDAKEWADSLQRNGGFIPGFRPGAPTKSYLNTISKRLTLFGSLYLAALTIIPTIIFKILGTSNAFGATSVMILVGVSMEMIEKYNSEMRVRNYKSLID